MSWLLEPCFTITSTCSSSEMFTRVTKILPQLKQSIRHHYFLHPRRLQLELFQ